MKATRDQRGFGLLEMTIAMAVMGLLVGGAVSMLFRSQVSCSRPRPTCASRPAWRSTR